jgi:hypothetical protein
LRVLTAEIHDVLPQGAACINNKPFHEGELCAHRLQKPRSADAVFKSARFM